MSNPEPARGAENGHPKTTHKLSFEFALLPIRNPGSRILRESLSLTLTRVSNLAETAVIVLYRAVTNSSKVRVSESARAGISPGER